jgi:hypothetical protein
MNRVVANDELADDKFTRFCLRVRATMSARTRNADCSCRLLADDHCSFSFGGLPGELEITFRPLSKAVQQWQLVPAGPVDLKQLVYNTQAGLVSRHTITAVNEKRQGEMEDENQPMDSSHWLRPPSNIPP